MAVTPFQFAAELAAAADVDDEVAAVGKKHGEAITEDWQQIIPGTPWTGPYQGAGFTGSPGANKAIMRRQPGRVTVDVFNQSFVAWFLQAGTPHRGPVVDLFGAADPHIEQWVDDLGGEVGL